MTVSPPASEAGAAILKQGGSAVDAAVATALALAVTHPAAGNIGGGGYMLVVPDDGKQAVVFDFREIAPTAATEDMFVRPEDRTAHRRIGVPGTVRGLALAHQRFGKLPWQELVAPAVKLAAEGFPLNEAEAKSINDVLRTSDRKQFAELHRVYGKPEGGEWKAGDILLQPDLAKTLSRIAERGADGFYRGETAELIAREMKRGGGIITLEDLAEYQARERSPARGTYRGYEILGASPSSSGGTTLILALQILENFELSRDRAAPENLHLMIESMKRAYRERAAHLGDPEVNEIPAKLLTKEFARELARGIDPRRATPSRELAGEIEITAARESEETTHLSVIDKNRLAVSLTYTLENSWGSRVVVPGGGFLLNDEMNDFNWLPGTTDTQGRIGTRPNLVAPRKRMLSSMCPTIIRRDGKTVLITGSPGGRTIINTVFCTITNVVDYEMDIRAAVDAPRLHHQWFPDAVRMEPAWKTRHAESLEKLRELGHSLEKPARQGDAHSIWIDPRTSEITAAADRRIAGSAAGY